jgi:hypothetical protein
VTKRAFTENVPFGGRTTSAETTPPPGLIPAVSVFDRSSLLIGLRQGKIVAAGSASLFDDLKPGATVAVHVDYVSCVKVDEVRAYVVGNGL